MTPETLRAALICAALGALSPVPAMAHASLQPAEAPAGKTYRAVIGIGHGCDGQATQSLRVLLPDGFYDAKPMPKPGWSLHIGLGPYAKPFDDHGTLRTQGAREITWSGGALEDDWFDEFTIRGRIGPEVAPGSRLFFRVVQECAQGRAEWTDTSGGPDAAHPAPFVTVTAAAAPHQAGPAQVTQGDLALGQGLVRATPPGARLAGGFLAIANAGAADDRLLAASSEVAGRVEIHEMTMQGDVMRMRPLPQGLPIPAGGRVLLRPGGTHLMFMDLKRPLVEGESVPLVLDFQRAGRVVLSLPVGPRDGGMPDARGQDHGAEGHDH
ncbi:MAG: DUF1775 domain-containing protein [Paracoccus sp. (in: a-proteobacteria)]|uniref:copper chaperone PCu(A)C n=1 Tax=Paracoccus sp. TaxID=267 RepID=UPI0039E7078F